MEMVAEGGSKSKRSVYLKLGTRRKRTRMEILLDVPIERVHLGTVIIQLYDDLAPRTADNFRALCTHRKGFGYKGSKFFRILKGFMMQGGDFSNNDGIGGKSIYGWRFEDENNKVKHDKAGMLTMANCGKNKNTSQFMIVEEPAEWLDGEHVGFGRVVDNLKLISEIIEDYGDTNGSPLRHVIIEDCGEVNEDGSVPDRELVTKESVRDELWLIGIFEGLIGKRFTRAEKREAEHLAALEGKDLAEYGVPELDIPEPGVPDYGGTEFDIDSSYKPRIPRSARYRTAKERLAEEIAVADGTAGEIPAGNDVAESSTTGTSAATGGEKVEMKDTVVFIDETAGVEASDGKGTGGDDSGSARGHDGAQAGDVADTETPDDKTAESV